MTPAPGYFHLHLISDSTGETLITVARAAAAQYSRIMPVEHVHEERLSDIVEILAHGLLWLDVLRDYHGSIRSHNFRRFVTEGGLISFGIDQAALYRLAASYVATAS